MKWRRHFGWIGLCGVMGLLGASDDARADELELTVETTAPLYLDLALDGDPVRLLLDLESPGLVILNGSREAEIGLLSNPILSRLPISIDLDGAHLGGGKTGRTPVRFPDGRRSRHRVIWFEGHDLVEMADGIVGPGLLSGYGQVRLNLPGGADADTGTGDENVQVYLFDGVPGLSPELALQSDIGPVHVGFSLISPTRMDDAAYHRSRQIGLVGRASRELEDHPMGWLGRVPAVSIPNSGLSLAGVEPTRFVRHLRREEREALAEHRARADREVVMEQIIVRATRPDPRPGRPGRLILGRDVLMTCLELVFDFQTQTTRLTCPLRQFPGPGDSERSDRPHPHR